MDIRELLFGRNNDFAKDGGPLFHSQAHLARVIIKIEGGGFEKKEEKSVCTLINQALRPDSDDHSRPISPNLRKALFSAIKERLHEKIDLEGFIVKIKDAITELKGGTETGPLSGEKEFMALEEAARSATTHFIVTYKPSENTDSSRADELIELMAKKLCLIKGEQSKETHYYFYVKNKNVVIQFWKRLKDFLISKEGMREEDVKEGLEKVNKISKKFSLNVFCIDPILCIQPTVVFDPEKSTRSGFVLHYHPENKVSVSRMSQESLKEWYDEFYLKVTTMPKVWRVEEVSWNDAFESFEFLKKENEI